MKKTILTVAILSAVLISCNETKQKQENTEASEVTEPAHEHHGKEMHAETHSIDNDWENEIKLENGTKWDANPETNEGVAKMLSSIKSSDPKTVEDYHVLASDLNETKNSVVKKCTMEGASHDNLHVFLLPLIEKIDALGKVSTMDEGSEVLARIKANLDAYYNYFK